MRERTERFYTRTIPLAEGTRVRQAICSLHTKNSLVFFFLLSYEKYTDRCMDPSSSYDTQTCDAFALKRLLWTLVDIELYTFLVLVFLPVFTQRSNERCLGFIVVRHLNHSVTQTLSSDLTGGRIYRGHPFPDLSCMPVFKIQISVIHNRTNGRKKDLSWSSLTYALVNGPTWVGALSMRTSMANTIIKSAEVALGPPRNQVLLGGRVFRWCSIYDKSNQNSSKKKHVDRSRTNSAQFFSSGST
jgi:hypothetical protein